MSGSTSAASGVATPGSPAPFDAQALEFDRRVGLPEQDCRAIAAAALALAEVRPGDALAEIGAGTGMIGNWFLAHPVRYLGLDLSRGMLEVFRHRPGTRRPWLAQADGARPWPFPDGSMRAVFSSRAIHLLPLEHVVDELFRVGAPGGSACLLGRVERPPESVKARLAREMQRRLRELGFQPRGGAGGRRLLEACRERGGRALARAAVVRRPVLHTPRQSLDQWASKPGLGGVALPPGVQDEVLRGLAAWAVETFGDLDAAQESEETYVLEGVRLPGRSGRGEGGGEGEGGGGRGRGEGVGPGGRAA
jgi:SAM-dependent methyltransferase